MTATQGKLVVFCGPSGAGKSSLAKKVMERYPVFQLSVSATTRQPREGEEHGVHYWFLSVDQFKQKLEEGAFLEHEEVYADLFYGTLTQSLTASGKMVRSPSWTLT